MVFRPRVSPRRRRHRTRGQSLAEFALTLPLLTLLLLVCADFGRVFLGWVALNNASRVAANFAAQHPYAWGSPGDPVALSEYQQEIAQDTGAIDCTMASPAPAPTFPGGAFAGAPAKVTLTCQFGLITPFMSNLMGGPINLTSTSSFPITSVALTGIPAGSIPPGTPSPSPSSSASPSSSPSSSPTPTPTPMCTVPNLVGVRSNQAPSVWGTGPNGAGFLLPIAFNPGVPPQYTIGHQNISPGTSQPCGSTIVTVTP